MSIVSLIRIVLIDAPFQHEADPEEGLQVREQVRQASEEGRGIQLPQPTEAGKEEGIHPRGGRQGGKHGGQNKIR